MEHKIKSLIRKREKTLRKRIRENVPSRELRCIEQILYELRQLLENNSDYPFTHTAK